MKTKFKCGGCNWKFMRTYQPALCPYCGKASVVPDELQAADDLLRDID